MEHPQLILQTAYRTNKRKDEAKSFVIKTVVAFILGITIGFSITSIITKADEIEISEAPAVLYHPSLQVEAPVVETATEVVESPESSEAYIYMNGSDNPYASIQISDSEAYELRWVVALEAQGEGFRGECAVVEAIFNRVISPKDWGGSIHGVLSKKGQFSTYKTIGSSRAWAVPGEMEDDAISEVLRTGPSILPSIKYVYFDSLGGKNGKERITIGHHTFGRE